jgi:5-methylcytosine-specific restriction endonuclease McrBC regulatory subunit McrC
MAAPKQLLELREYGSAVTLPSSTSEFIDFQKHAGRWKQRLGLSEEPFDVALDHRKSVTVRARAVTGFVRIGRFQLEIAPKFLNPDGPLPTHWRLALWQILASVSNRPDLAEETTAAHVRIRSFPDLLGYVFVRSLREARLSGTPRGYVEVSADLRMMRGRIDFSRMPQLITRPDRLPLVVDEYSTDIPVNRLLKWAAGELSRTVLSTALSRELMEERNAFEEVALDPPGLIEAERLVLPPQFKAFEPALEVSRLLLRGHTLQHGLGDRLAPGFLWNSAAVFESFMKRLVARAGRRLQLSFNDKSLRLATSIPDRAILTLRTAPDARLIEPAGQIVLDAKYKVWRQKPKAADTYQVLAGARVAGADIAVLLYPSGMRRAPVHWQLHAAGHPQRLSAVFVSLPEAGLPGGQNRLVNALVEDLEAVVAV